MKQFMDKDFLLSTPTAQHLFHDYADKMPNLKTSLRYGSAATIINGVR